MALAHFFTALATKRKACIREVFFFCLVFFLALSSPALANEEDVNAKIELFGTVALRAKLDTLKQWTSVRQKHAKKNIFSNGGKLNAGTSWENFKKQVMPLSDLEKIKIVHRFWNQWPYREDSSGYKQSDYWASPHEFSINSGDCEDYSIAKYYTLRALGIPASNMRIVIVTETIRNLAHAVLVVYIDGKAYVLDNLSRNVLEHTRFRNYLPHYSFNEEQRWIHVRKKRR